MSKHALHPFRCEPPLPRERVRYLKDKPGDSYESESKDLFSRIAKAYFQQGNLEKAIKILDKRIISSEITNPIYKEFAKLCCLESRYEDAIKCIEKIFCFSNKNFMDEIFLGVANEHMRNGDWEKAEETAGYLKDKPGDSYENVCLSIGQVYIERGELDKAATTLREIIYKTHERDKIFSELAKKYYDNNDLENAIKYNVVCNDNHGSGRFHLK